MSMDKKKSIAIVGSGISGLASAYAFTKQGDWNVEIFEAESTLGGHSLTVDSYPGGPKVDLGFQVMNRTTYPYLSAMFHDLQVETEPSDMSFGVSVDYGKLEWASHGLDSVFAQRRNALNPRFLLMIREIFRFAAEATEVLEPSWNPLMTLGEYLTLREYSQVFIDDYLLPMTAAVWSVPHAKMMDFPIVAFIRFWDNHHLLNPIGDRPRWRVVTGRTETYVKAIEAFVLKHAGKIHLNQRISRLEKINTPNGKQKVSLFNSLNSKLGEFDQVILATHSPTSTKILESSKGDLVSNIELSLLKSIPYQMNAVYLHKDEKQMPTLKNVWSSWNVLYNSEKVSDVNAGVCVTYWLNRLQNLPEDTPTLLCTLNPIDPIDEHKILCKIDLEHPVFTPESIRAQKALNELQSNSNGENKMVWLAGAYLGNGFHEDGIRSAMAIAKQLDAAPFFVHEDSPALKLVRGPSPNVTKKQRIGLAIFEAVARLVIKKGFLRVVLPNGDELGPFGRTSKQQADELNEPTCNLWVDDVDALYRCVRDSDIGVGEAYMEGAIKCEREGDILNLLHILVLNMDEFSNLEKTHFSSLKALYSPITSIAMGLYKWGNALNNVKHRFRKNTVEGSRRNIQAHYDIGNPLYELFLDDTMTYSSGIHTTRCGAEIFGNQPNLKSGQELDLYEAQLAKLDAIIARAGLKKSDVVLEIGCGWGSFAIRAAETIGCLVIGITISTEQLKIAKERVAAKGLEHLVDLRICDYRKLGVEPGTPRPEFFDKIVSIEMLEAVGEEHLLTYFETVDRMLKPGGTALIQVIGLPDDRYEAYCAGSDFIREHVFPGGHLPSIQALNEATQGTRVRLQAVDDIGLDYAITLRMWRERFMSKKDQVISLGYPERFIRLWEFYLAYCEVGFERKAIHDWHLKFVKSESSSDVPFSPVVVSNNGVVADKTDVTTLTLLGIWVLLCAMAVRRIGTESLVIPFFMSLQTIPNYLLGVFRPSVANQKVRYGWFVRHSMFSMLSVGLVLLGLVNAAPISPKIFTMIAVGHYAGDLFSTVAGGFLKISGFFRILFLSFVLVYATFQFFLIESVALYESVMYLMIVDLAASSISLVKKYLSVERKLNMSSYLYRSVSALSVFGSVFIRLGLHLLFFSRIMMADNASMPEFVTAKTMFFLLGSIIIISWDLREVSNQYFDFQEDWANTWNTDQLIVAQPDKFNRKGDQLAHSLCTAEY